MQTRNLIDGTWVGAASGRELEVRNPATDEVIAKVPAIPASAPRSNRFIVVIATSSTRGSPAPWGPRAERQTTAERYGSRSRLIVL